jgi:hypothetical protein
MQGAAVVGVHVQNVRDGANGRLRNLGVRLMGNFVSVLAQEDSKDPTGMGHRHTYADWDDSFDSSEMEKAGRRFRLNGRLVGDEDFDESYRLGMIDGTMRVYHEGRLEREDLDHDEAVDLHMDLLSKRKKIAFKGSWADDDAEPESRDFHAGPSRPRGPGLKGRSWEDEVEGESPPPTPRPEARRALDVPTPLSPPKLTRETTSVESQLSPVALQPAREPAQLPANPAPPPETPARGVELSLKAQQDVRIHLESTPLGSASSVSSAFPSDPDRTAKLEARLMGMEQQLAELAAILKTAAFGGNNSQPPTASGQGTSTKAKAKKGKGKGKSKTQPAEQSTGKEPKADPSGQTERSKTGPPSASDKGKNQSSEPGDPRTAQPQPSASPSGTKQDS